MHIHTSRRITYTIVLLHIVFLSKGFAQDIFIFGAARVYPFGWESEEQVAGALSALAFNPVRYELSSRSDSFELISPVSGHLAQSGDWIILQSESITISYPKLSNAEILHCSPDLQVHQ
jgi:hypothetical protein